MDPVRLLPVLPLLHNNAPCLSWTHSGVAESTASKPGQEHRIILKVDLQKVDGKLGELMLPVHPRNHPQSHDSTNTYATWTM